MSWFKKIFGGKKKEEEKPLEPLLPIKDEEQPISVPIEENIGDKWDEEENKKTFEERFTNMGVMDIVQPEEPIAPTLERQEIKQEDIDKLAEVNRENFLKEHIEKTKKELDKEDWIPIPKNKKPKRQAKKKDNRDDKDDRASWPGNKHFNL